MCIDSQNTALLRRMPVKLVIVGAGALGSIIAGHLAKAGQDVTLDTFVSAVSGPY
jgi:pyruvate/2-oxoglutarate dehydrogenase complex dihydrolipoamide dehydrogenase (E3) component